MSKVLSDLSEWGEYQIMRCIEVLRTHPQCDQAFCFGNGKGVSIRYGTVRIEIIGSIESRNGRQKRALSILIDSSIDWFAGH